MSQYTLDERAAIMANARAILAETAPAAQREAISPHTSGSELVYKTRVTNDERPRPRAVPKPDVHETYDDDDAVLSASASAYATSKTAAGEPWRTWVEKYCEYRHSVMRDAIGQVLGEFRAQAREHCEREVGLRKLQDDVADAQKQVPTVPAIVARFDAEQSGLKAEQARLQRELEATTKKVGRLRVDQALGDYSISQLRKETEASKAASIELETSTSRFVMRNINPVAARTLRDFAAQVIDARDGGAVWLSGPAGTA
jgi:hypothetical protein